MAKRPRRNHSPAFKAKVALAAVQGDKTVVELSEHVDIHANQSTQWKSHQLPARASEAFEGSGPSAPPVDVKTLHAKIGVEALYRKPKTTKRHPEHKVYPYLLRGLPITRANQVWAMDMTYLPMARGFVYLTVVMDWYSRRVLSHRVSISMDAQFCLDALEQAIEKHGTPAIMNTDQGSQFTSLAFTRYLSDNGIQISMDGKGAWRDNVFVERLWRTVKYEHVYLHAYESTRDAKSKIAHYLTFYNQRRPHSALDRQTPDQVYFNSLPSQEAA